MAPLQASTEGAGASVSVSVLIPVHGDRGLIDLTLDALDRQETQHRFEVLVIDNGDNGDLIRRLGRRDRAPRVLTESQPGSYAARNTGVAAATGDVLAFTDADCLPRPDWLEQGVSALEDAGPSTFVGGAITLVPARPGRLNLAEVWQIGHDLRQDWYVRDGWAATANLFVRASDLHRVGPFNASLRSGGDKEWGTRATGAGVRGVFSDAAAIEHPTRPTMAELMVKRHRVSRGSVDLALARGVPVHVGGTLRALRPPLRKTWRQPTRQPMSDLDRARLVGITAGLHVYQRLLERGLASRSGATTQSVPTVSLFRSRPAGPAEADTESDRPERPPLDVSVVIPTLNGAQTLAVQLGALARQRTARRFEVLVADNGSTDGTAEVVAEWADRLPGLRLVDASASTGSNAARNAGTAAAVADTVLLCDSDDEVDEGWLEALANGLGSADGVGGTLELDRLNARYAAAPGQPGSVPGVAVQLGFLPRPTGANAGFRKHVWEELGGFDEGYVRGGTETEFFWRLQLAGHSFREVPEAVVHYRMRESPRASLRQMYTWGRQHAMLYRDFRGHGLAADRVGTARDCLRTARVAVTLPWHRDRRMELAQRVVYRAGRVAGSWRYRVVFP